MLYAYVHTYSVCKETHRVVPGGYQANQASRSNIMKRISLWSVDRDDTLHIDDEIKKLEEAHSVMISANRALVEGEIWALLVWDSIVTTSTI